MTTENNTTQAPAATLTEKELWALFVRNAIHTSMGAGMIIERYRPDDYLRDAGSWGNLLDFSNEVADDIEVAESPSEELSVRVEELENYLPLLKIVADDFERFKVALQIEGEDGDAPLYRSPLIGGTSEAA